MRHLVALTITLSSILVVWCTCALALDPTLDVSQYAHTSWKVRDGFTKGAIQAIAQTPDGYLWLGTEFGLLRFDGVRNVPWQPPGAEHLPSNDITSLLVGRDGALWIGTKKGLLSWKAGKLTQYSELAGQLVAALVEDREGTVWAGGISLPPPGRLCAIQESSIHCDGADGSLGLGVLGLYEERSGNLWVGVQYGVWRWKPGTPQFYPIQGEKNGILGFAEDDAGALMIATHVGIRRVPHGRFEPYSLPGSAHQFLTYRMLRDHDGGLWIGTVGQGLLHVHEGKTDVFTQADGLSGREVGTLLEDREGSVWVATTTGLDRFREFTVTTLWANQASAKEAYSVLASKDGSVWLSTSTGLNRLNHGVLSIYGKDGKLDRDNPNALFQDRRGRIWVSTYHGFGYLENSRFIPVRGIPGGFVHSIAEDTAGSLWIANQENGLFRLSVTGDVQQIPWAGLGHEDHATALAVDPFLGGLWIGFYKGGVDYFADGGVRGSSSVGDGLGAGWVSDLRFSSDGTLWAATEGGLSRVKNGRVSTITSKEGLPCNSVQWVIEDDAHSLWLRMPCGLVRLAKSELDAWAAGVDQNKATMRPLQATVFDTSDGVRSPADAGGYGPHIARSSDGKLWFTGLDGVSVIDPHHLAINKLPPPVHIEKIIADSKTYDALNGLSLPPHVRDFAIDYTALSLVEPEKIHFRYKLEGQDPDWREVVNVRQVQYSNLAPRHYTFHVMACNNSGVWNEAGTSLEFSVLPAFYQTNWFRILCVLGFLALLWSIYQLRIQQLREQFNIGLEARVNERTRIARELHDTLLQNFHGLMFQFQAARNLMSRRPDEAMQSLDDAISETKKAIAESRDAIQGLRSDPIAKGNLAELLTSTSRELAESSANEHPPIFDLIEEGERRPFSSAVSNDLCRIARELVRNAYQHAHSQRMEVELRYGDSMFRLRIRDDGRGIDPKVLKEGGRTGHWGLRGIRERADQIGAHLDVWSEPGNGTEVQLLVPAEIAYESHRDSYRAKLVRKVKSRAQRS